MFNKVNEFCFTYNRYGKYRTEKERHLLRERRGGGEGEKYSL